MTKRNPEDGVGRALGEASRKAQDELLAGQGPVVESVEGLVTVGMFPARVASDWRGVAGVSEPAQPTPPTEPTPVSGKQPASADGHQALFHGDIHPGDPGTVTMDGDGNILPTFAEMAQMLRELEAWMGERECAVCGAIKPGKSHNSHEDSCRLAALLKRLP